MGHFDDSGAMSKKEFVEGGVLFFADLNQISGFDLKTEKPWESGRNSDLETKCGG